MFGWHQPWPFEWGGGPTEVERAWTALRDAVGRGGTAKSLESVDGVWREAKSQALAALRCAGERAAMQAWPDQATDFLEWYERVLLLQPAANDTDVDRQAAATTLWTKEIRSTGGEIEEQLRRIDERFSVLHHTLEQSTTTIAGRTVEPLDGTLPFGGGRIGTEYPLYSSLYVHFVLLDLGGAAPGDAELRAIELARALLDEVLPAWETYQIIHEVGVVLDQSFLDGAAFGA